MKKHFNSTQKVAALLLAFGEDVASELLKNMSRDEAARVLSAMQELGRLDAGVVDGLVDEFYTLLNSGKGSLRGGRDAARKLLSSAFKGEGAADLEKVLEHHGLDSVRGADPEVLADLIRSEHPQTMTIVLACCEPAQAGKVLKALPEALHTELLTRLGSLETVDAHMLRELDETLRERMEKRSGRNSLKKGGVTQVSAMLAKLDKEAAGKFLEDLELRDPEMVARVRDHMFLFSDLATIPPEDLRTLVTKVPQKKLILALRGADKVLTEKICSVMSERAALLFKDDLEASKPSPKKDVLSAQKDVLTLYHKLEAAGKMIGKDTEMV